MKTQTYNRKPFQVEAVQVTVDNLEKVAEWCQGILDTDFHPEDEVGKVFIRVKVKHPLNARQTKAYLGDWVLKAGEGFKVYNDVAFEKSFEPTQGSRVHPNQAELNLL